ncbi:hypothetical protein D9M73_116970 [compost metagenome]
MRAGHVGTVAAIEALYRRRILADRGAHAVHRGIAAANDDDMLARRIEATIVERRHGIAEILAVGGGEESERVDDALLVHARRLDRARAVHAGRNQHRIMTLAQFVERGITANLEIFVEDDAARLQPIDPAHDDGLFQLEAGDAIGQQPACTIVTIIDVYVIAARAQIFGGAEACGACADHADRLAARRAGHERLDPAFFPGGIGDELFDRSDRHRAMAGKFDDAIAFAQPVLRADAAANLGHGRGGIAQLIGFAQAAFGGEAQPVGDVIVQRAMHRAIRHAALRAAPGLILCLGRGIALGDFAEILGTDLGFALGWVSLLAIDELQ